MLYWKLKENYPQLHRQFTKDTTNVQLKLHKSKNSYKVEKLIKFKNKIK